MGSIFFGTSLFGYPLNTMLMFAIIALIPMIFGHTVYNWALKWVSAPVVSLSLLGEPIGASILAYLFLGETPGFFTLIGSVLTLTGILICVYKPFEKKVYEE
jgi:drug/metabolite transporter (DMT)-like permease